MTTEGEYIIAELVRNVVRQELPPLLAQAFAATRVETPPIAPMSLSRFAQEFRAGQNGSLAVNTMDTYLYALEDFVRVVGDVDIQSVDAMMIEKYLSKKALHTSDQTARKHYASLRSMFETANRWALIKSNPFRAVKKPRVRELRAAYFTVREFSMLLASMPEGTMKDLTATAALTGMRLSELLALQWEDIDFDKRLILVQNSDHFTTKSRRNRAIPMHVEVVRLLQQRKCISRSEIIFSENGEPLSRFEASHRFKNYVRKGGYNDRLHFHSLRHTFGTLLVRTGVPIYEVKELMGHRSITTTEMYAQMASAGLHGAVGKIPLHIPSARRKGSKAIQRVA